ncbi:hypothetical protein CQA49_06555 [Helicobacter sp. MIT 00-7814]|uniref:hypothetical protein n=1 Tax=unclassified Helicobacter TaxID=2593540 RepID=UPI000E1FA82C|nr:MULTISPECIES: hypothetical protein [unclassified Helicobacter]RDU53575.1 hypothetical protein CQA49_06555 [Helicobacter sp. MIT 00-7814]RDU56999.1 hypothetical protein CQA37_00910 [Helicobacter sp. MIT 99-10781]
MNLRVMWALLLQCAVFVACSDVRNTSMIPTTNTQDLELSKKLERKVQNSRKAEIVEGKSTPYVAIATYLNDVDYIKEPREVFLVELYEKKPNPNIQKLLTFKLSSSGISQDSLFITRLKPSQYTDILRPKNSYNALFIVEFESISKKHRETMNLQLSIKDGNKNVGVMLFDFGYATLKSKLR